MIEAFQILDLHIMMSPKSLTLLTPTLYIPPAWLKPNHFVTISKQWCSCSMAHAAVVKNHFVSLISVMTELFTRAAASDVQLDILDR